MRSSLLGALLLIACRDSAAPPSDPPRSTIAGQYALQSVDGKSLPTSLVLATGNPIVIMAGSLTVTRDDQELRDYYGLLIAKWGDFVVRTNVGNLTIVDAFIYGWQDAKTMRIYRGLYSSDQPMGTATVTGATILYMPIDGHRYAYTK